MTSEKLREEIIRCLNTLEPIESIIKLIQRKEQEAQKELFTQEEIKWLQILLISTRREDLSTPILNKLKQLNEDNK